MFKSFIDGLASGSQAQGSGGQGQGANGSGSGSKNGVTPAQLRSDVYSAIDLMGVWISSGKAENGIDYRSILTIIDKHFPGTQINRCTDEVPILVGGLVNMIFEYSKADGIPAAMALRTFTERLTLALEKIGDQDNKKNVGEGIIRGLNSVADPALATREFAPRVQMVGSLKGLTATIYGKGSAEARNADVVWSSKFI